MKSILNRITCGYLIITVAITLIGRIIPIKILIGPHVDALLYILLASLGAVILLFDLFSTKIWYKGANVFVLYGFIGIMAISSLLNLKYGFSDNIKTIAWTTIHFALFYTMYLRLEKKQMISLIDKIWIGVCAVWFIPICYSIYQFISQEAYAALVDSERYVRQGFVENRLFGVFNDPNYAAIMSLGVFFACVYLFSKYKNKFFRAFMIINFILQPWYIVLSGSRTALVTFCISLTLFLWLKIYQKNKKAILYFVTPIIAICLVCGGDYVVKKVSSPLPQVYEAIFEDNHTTDNQHPDNNKPSLDNKDILNRVDSSADNISNNRFTIWKSYLEDLDGDILFGGSPRNFLSKWIDKNPDGYLAGTHYETHNGYLSVLVATGVLGFATILAFAVLYFISIIKYFKTQPKIENEFIFLLVFLALILVYTFFFTELFFIHCYTSVLFWLHCGILNYWIGSPKAKQVKKNKRRENL